MPKNISKQQTSADDDENSTNFAKTANNNAGISPGDKGNTYQKRWTLYLALKCFTLGTPFRITFELPAAEAGLFDDISLQIGGTRYFIQVKHCATTGGKVTRGKLFPRSVKQEKGAFALSKYNGALPRALVEGGNGDVWCVLLTNAALDERCDELFEERAAKVEWAKGRSLCLVKSCGDVEKFHEMFVDHFVLLTEQHGLAELAEEIKMLLRKKFSEHSVENVFYMLEYEITRLIHEESKTAQPRTNLWLEKLFETFHEQNYLKFFSYTFEDIVQNYANVELSSRTELLEGKMTVLPYKQSYLLRMIQARQMVGQDDYWFVPLDSLERKSTKDSVLQALEKCETSRVLILLDNGEKEELVGDMLAKLSNMIMKIVVITNCDTKKLKDRFGAIVQEDCQEISLDDLKCSELYYSYEVSFQGRMLKLSDLPSFEAFKSELSGDPLIALLRGQPLTIGTDLSDGAPTRYYEPRKLAPIAFEINAAELAQRTILTTVNPNLLKSEAEIFACASIANSINSMPNLKVPVHILNSIAGDRWRWCESVPNTAKIIATAIKHWKPQGDDDDYKVEDAIATRIDTVFKPLVELVRLSPADAIDEDRFVDGLSVDGRMVIIGGETGAGKSTTLRRLAELYKRKNPRQWVVCVNLSGHELVENDRGSGKVDEEWVRQFLLTKITGEDGSFVERYFARCSPGDVVVFIDSFDEVCKTYIEKAFNIVKKLIEMKVHRIVISSRQYQEFLLFNEWPKCKIFHLMPLSFEDQLKMLRNILQSEGKPLSQQTIQALQNLQDQLKQDVSNSSSTIKLGSSLAIHMLAQLVSDPRSGSTLTVTSNLTILDLFERYVECFIRKAGEQKLGLNCTANQFHEDNKRRRQDFYEKLGYVALKKRLPLEGLKALFKTTEREKLDQLQVESSQMSGLAYPNLKHRSFEEFFFACTMQGVYVDSGENLDAFWKYFKRFFNGENGLVRVFFFHRLAKRLGGVKRLDEEGEERGKLLELIRRIDGDGELPDVSAEERELPGVRRVLGIVLQLINHEPYC